MRHLICSAFIIFTMCLFADDTAVPNYTGSAKPIQRRIRASQPVEDGYIDTRTGTLTREYTKYPRDRFGGIITEWSAPATGTFRTLKTNGRWWLVTPEGNLFLSTGICGFECAYDTYSENNGGRFDAFADAKAVAAGEGNRPWAKFFGRDHFSMMYYHAWKKWGADYVNSFYDYQLAVINDLGFNTIGAWSGAPGYLESRGNIILTTPVIGFLKAAEKYKIPMIIPKIPDFRHPDFRRACVERMKDYKIKRGSVHILGVFTDNELPWGKITDPKILEELAEAYYAATTAAIREAAPDVLILGDRLLNVDSSAVLAVAAKYVDVISFNTYVFLPPASAERMKSVDKPFIIGEWSFISKDSVHKNEKLRDWPAQPDNQHERGLAYKTAFADLLSRGCIVGEHWFILLDQSREGRPGEKSAGEGNNFGVIAETLEVYHDFRDHVVEFNSRSYDIALGKLRYVPAPSVAYTASSLYADLKQFVWVIGSLPAAQCGSFKKRYNNDLFTTLWPGAAEPVWGAEADGWIEYAFNAYDMQQASIYLRYQSEKDYELTIIVDGRDAGAVLCKGSGKGVAFTPAVPIFPLTAGKHIIRFVTKNAFPTGGGVAIDGFFVSDKKLQPVNSVNRLRHITAPKLDLP
ncbi:MAG: hypothetical protein HZC28_20570 [Spirochaetes bacterium]|nr:hypothetical protein [Spirochaetota bacterium]